MRLALHRVVAEVGEQPEPAWTVLLPHSDGDLPHAAQVPPHLGLVHVPLWHREQHHRYPAQTVAEDHDLLVVVQDLGGLAAGDDLAEYTIVLHQPNNTERRGEEPAARNSQLATGSWLLAPAMLNSMADVHPLRAIRYNPALDLSLAVCPPFDTISPEEQDRLYARSPYNAVRVELAKADGGTRYENAARTLGHWLDDGTLLRDESPAYYLYRQTFNQGGTDHTRTILFARLRVVPWSDGVVLPHEQTFGAPKEDRIQNMRATKVNASPVFLLYRDRTGGIGAITARYGGRSIEFRTEDGQRHAVTRIDDAEAVTALQRAFEAETLYIADGHHRYETALVYRDEVKAQSAPWSGEEPANFALVALVAADDPGLLVLPIHRMTGAGGDWDEVRPRLESMFSIDRVSGDLMPAVAAQAGRSVFGLVAGESGDNLLLTVKNQATVDAVMPRDRSAAWKALDYSIANHAIMQACLGLTTDQMKDYETVQFTEDASEAEAAVRGGKSRYAVIMNPISARKVLDLADAGERMPQKSTFFYPKVPTGIVFNPVE